MSITDRLCERLRKTPRRLASLVVDLKKGTVGYPFLRPIEKVIERSRALLDAFRQRGLPVAQVVITGVEATARQAHELGFNVTLAIDAMTDAPPRHTTTAQKSPSAAGETGTAQQIIELLETQRV